MIANYHTHTFRCHHAEGTMEEYVQKGIERGLKVLGFTDHVPMPFSNGHRSSFRMAVEETKEYVNEILELKEKYKDQIELYVGYEAEYYPKEFEGMLKLLTSYPIDYLILGQHFSNNEYDGKGNMGLTTHEDMKRLVDTYIAAMDLGVYSYIAHPDLMPYTGEHYDEEVRRLLRHAVKTDTPVEYNLLGMSTQRFYPHPRFWELVKEEGAKCVLGCDAHTPDAVANPAIVAQGEQALASFGLTPLEKITFKPVHR